MPNSQSRDPFTAASLTRAILRRALPLAGLLSLLAPACSFVPIDYTTCASDIDCPSGACGLDGHCQSCSADGTCAPEPSCAVIGCLGLTPAGCESDADCAAGEACVAGACGVSPSCTRNADCAASDVCLKGECTLVGSCLSDAYCTCAAPLCVDHACVGERTCPDVPPPPPVPCSITADCPEKFYCVAGACAFAIECRAHADCPAGEGCFRRACWPI